MRILRRLRLDAGKRLAIMALVAGLLAVSAFAGGGCMYAPPQSLPCPDGSMAGGGGVCCGDAATGAYLLCVCTDWSADQGYYNCGVDGGCLYETD
jgi:hypothetical protein